MKLYARMRLQGRIQMNSYPKGSIFKDRGDSQTIRPALKKTTFGFNSAFKKE